MPRITKVMGSNLLFIWVGFSVLIICGDFQKGEVELLDLDLVVGVQPGDAYIMRADILLHDVRGTQGVRFTWIFFTHDTMFFPPAEEPIQASPWLLSFQEMPPTPLTLCERQKALYDACRRPGRDKEWDLWMRENK